MVGFDSNHRTGAGISRRRVLQAGFGLVTLAALPPGLQGCARAATSPSPLTFPSLLRARNGVLNTELVVSMTPSTVGGKQLVTNTYAGSIPGPTLRAQPGDVLEIDLRNQLGPMPPNYPAVHSMNRPHDLTTTNLHTHGMHVSPEGNSDNVFVSVAPGQSHRMRIKIPANHPGGLFWYHPHHHGASFTQLRGGMAGAIIVDGPLDEVPQVKAAGDSLLVIQSIQVGANGQVPTPNPHGKSRAEIFPLDVDNQFLTVNGVVGPTMQLRPGEVRRLRILNATANGIQLLRFNGGKLHVLAIDGLTLPAVSDRDFFFLSPGNRVEVLIVAPTAGQYSLDRHTFLPGADITDRALPSGGDWNSILTIDVAGDPTEMTLPSALPTQSRAIKQSEIARERTVTFNELAMVAGSPGTMDNSHGGNHGMRSEVDGTDRGSMHMSGSADMGMDGRPFNPGRIDISVDVGTAERWTVKNESGEVHAFHIHTNPFYVTHANGNPVPAPYWADVVNVDAHGSVQFDIRFADFAGKIVQHCHYLDDEDLGMMQTVEMVRRQQ